MVCKTRSRRIHIQAGSGLVGVLADVAASRDRAPRLDDFLGALRVPFDSGAGFRSI